MRWVLILVAAGSGCMEAVVTDAGDVFELLPAPGASTTVLADGSARVPLQVTLAEDPRKDLMVTFDVTVGRFQEASETPKKLTIPASRRTVPVTFVADTLAGNAVVTATVEGFLQQLEITMTRALPADILLSANPVSAAADGKEQITLTAGLVPAGSGKITRGVPVNFEVLHADTLVPGLSQFVVYDGETPVTHSISSDMAGAFTVVAQMKGSQNESISSRMITVMFVAAPNLLRHDANRFSEIRAMGNQNANVEAFPERVRH